MYLLVNNQEEGGADDPVAWICVAATQNIVVALLIQPQKFALSETQRPENRGG